jgi:hypothetical protein
MIFKLAEAAEQGWRRLDGHNLLPKLILGVKFADGSRSRRKLKPLPPDPNRHQHLTIARDVHRIGCGPNTLWSASVACPIDAKWADQNNGGLALPLRTLLLILTIISFHKPTGHAFQGCGHSN